MRKYDRSFTWLKWTPSQDSVYGQDKPAWVPAPGVLWGNLAQTSASKQGDFDSTQATATGQIILRQWPNLDARDRLIDKQFNQTWIVDGIRKDNDANETIVDVHRFEEKSL